MAWKGMYRTSLVGGGVTALDSIDGDLLDEQTFALVNVGGTFNIYKVETNSGAAESSPDIIVPDTNAGTKRWILQQVGWVSDAGGMFLTSNFVKDPKRIPWIVGSEATLGFCGIINPSGVAGFINNSFSGSSLWDSLGYAGATSTVISDDVFVTVLDVSSGAGAITNLVLPGFTAQGNIATCKITIDETVHTIAFAALHQTDRFVAGVSETINNYAGSKTIALWPDAANVPNATRLPDGGTRVFHSILSPAQTISNGISIRYERSVLVEMKVSNVSTTNFRNRCGVAYTPDQ